MKTGDDGKASRNEGESSKIVEIDASTGERNSFQRGENGRHRPRFHAKNNEMLKPPEDAEQREQHQTLTEEEIAEKKWHKDGARRGHGDYQYPRAKEQRTPGKKTKNTR